MILEHKALMSIFSFWRKTAKPQNDHKADSGRPKDTNPKIISPLVIETIADVHSVNGVEIRRYFHNQHGFQCYTTWFRHWNGWISAGHCVTEAMDHTPDFVTQNCVTWPDGLDAALAGCILPKTKPAAPIIGRDVILQGYPAGCRTLETRKGLVYFERGAGQWIAHIKNPDEPVVTGMSGGPVLDAKSGEPIGIIITRNSPADLNNDRDPDESADFIALSEVWEALNKG